MSTAVVFQQMLVIFLLLGVGYVIFKKGWCRIEGTREFSFLITSVCSPALMIYSACDDTNTATRMDIVITAGVASAIFMILVVLGWLIPIALRVQKKDRKFYDLMTVYGNVGFIGIPVAAAVLGTASVIYVTIFNMVYNLFIYTHGILVLGGQDELGHVSPKKFINVGTIAGVLAVIIFWFHLPLPELIVTGLGYAGQCTTFLAMVTLGATLSHIKMREIFSIPRMYIFMLFRMVILPIGVAIIMKHLFTNTMMIGASVLMVAMPMGSMPLMMAEQCGMEDDILSKGIILSTLISVVTITIVSLFIS